LSLLLFSTGWFQPGIRPDAGLARCRLVSVLIILIYYLVVFYG
jgi:hypothetical protein